MEVAEFFVIDKCDQYDGDRLLVSSISYFIHMPKGSFFSLIYTPVRTFVSFMR